jgi:hypothetical protein
MESAVVWKFKPERWGLPLAHKYREEKACDKRRRRQQQQQNNNNNNNTQKLRSYVTKKLQHSAVDWNVEMANVKGGTTTKFSLMHFCTVKHGNTWFTLTSHNQWLRRLTAQYQRKRTLLAEKDLRITGIYHWR